MAMIHAFETIRILQSCYKAVHEESMTCQNAPHHPRGLGNDVPSGKEAEANSLGRQQPPKTSSMFQSFPASTFSFQFTLEQNTNRNLSPENGATLPILPRRAPSLLPTGDTPRDIVAMQIQLRLQVGGLGGGIVSCS